MFRGPVKNEIHVQACPLSLGNKIALWLSCSNEKYDKNYRFFWQWNKVVVKPKTAVKMCFAVVFCCCCRHGGGGDVKNIIDFLQGFIEKKSPGDALGSDSNAVQHTISQRLGAPSCAQIKHRF